DPFDDPDIDAALVEHATLLDVQLNISGDGAWSVARLGDARRIAANAADLLGEHHAVAPRPVDFIPWQVTNEAAAAGEAALLIAPDHHMQRMTIAVVALGEDVCYLDGRTGSDIAVVVAALGDGIDVRAEEDGERGGSRTGSHAEGVADRIDTDRQTRFPHQVHHEAATGDVGIAERHAAHTALRICPVLRKIGEMLVHARAVDAPALPVPLSRECAEGDDGLHEGAPLHVICPCRSPFSTGHRAGRNSHRQLALSAG